MGRIRENRNKQEQVVFDIRVLLENQGIDSDADWDKDPEKLRKLNPLIDGSSDYAINSDDLGITQEDDQNKLIFAVLEGGGTNDFHRELLKNEIVKVFGGSTGSIQLVFFVGDMSRRIDLELLYSRTVLNNLKKSVKKEARNGNPALKNIRFTLLTNFILLQKNIKQDVRLTDLHSLDMFQEPPLNREINLDTEPEETCNIRGQVFTADLYQLVKIYNLIGDTLFQNNVRFGIKEALGVDESIRQTLKKNPEYFWFKNNGVTILIQNSRTSLQESKSIRLGRLEPDKSPDFSVINGAQTITTAARYFFELEHKNRNASNEKERAGHEKELENAKKQARVLVRVIHIMSEEDVQAEGSPQSISIALNRQKPVRIEDIAFISPAVLKLTECLQRQTNPPFTLVRQGETSGKGRGMGLAAFARARLACAGLPGAARNNSRNKLFETRFDPKSDDGDGDTVFVIRELFPRNWLSIEDEAEEDIILNRDYRAIWFAHQTAAAYKKEIRNSVNDNQDISNVIKNGKWYFTAVITQILNGFRTYSTGSNRYLPDFSEFSGTVPDNLPQLMKSFAELAAAVARQTASGREINSNLFNRNDLYNSIIEKIRGYFDADVSTSHAQPPEFQEQIEALVSQMELPQTLPQARSTDIQANYVVLNNLRTDVNTDASALVAIASYIMTHYPDKEETILVRCGDWLYPASSATSIVGRTFHARGTMYCIEPHVNTPGKCARMKNLCGAAGIPTGEIKWHKPGDNGFTFSS